MFSTSRAEVPRMTVVVASAGADVGAATGVLAADTAGVDVVAGAGADAGAATGAATFATRVASPGT